MKHVQWFEFLMPEDPDGYLAMQRCLKEKFFRKNILYPLHNSVELMLWLIGRDGFDAAYLEKLPNWSGLTMLELKHAIWDLRTAKILTKVDPDAHPLRYKWVVDWRFFQKYVDMLKSVDPLVMIERARLALLEEQEIATKKVVL